MAEQAGVAYQQIQHYERGEQLPPLRRARVIAALFDATIEQWRSPPTPPGVAEPEVAFLDERAELMAIYDRLRPSSRAKLLRIAGKLAADQ